MARYGIFEIIKLKELFVSGYEATGKSLEKKPNLAAIGEKNIKII
jgi:hypothetical protein